MADNLQTIFRSAENLATLRKLHAELLGSLVTAAKLDQTLPQKLTTFMPRQGLLSTGELMIVGRAPNGWREGWTLQENQSPERREQTIRELEAEFALPKCPMAWANEPQPNWNWRRSPFTRLMNQLAEKLPDYSEQTWPSRLIWSNLYKIAPDKGGNPNNRLCIAQERVCLEYFAAELRIWQPKQVVLVTGWDWAHPFVNRLDPDASAKPSREQLVDWSGLVHPHPDQAPIPLVVCKRPERRRVANIVQEITAAFQKLAQAN